LNTTNGTVIAAMANAMADVITKEKYVRRDDLVAFIIAAFTEALGRIECEDCAMEAEAGIQGLALAREAWNRGVAMALEETPDLTSRPGDPKIIEEE
jgi:hypothetical protein